MTKNTNFNKNFDWYYTRLGGNIAVCAIRIWAHIFRSVDFKIMLDRPINPDEPTVMASNHQTLLDPPAVFAALSFSELLSFSPVKFMTWHKYYNSKYKLPLYTSGCYPSHGEGMTGVKGAVYYAENGYRSFIFPEGKRTRPNARGKAFNGISQVLTEIPDARLILVHLDWEKRTKLMSRPKLSVYFTDAPKKLNRNNPDAIMDAIYDIK